MGRAYHEQGEAPMALQYYQQAAECADTTDKDCDYAQLSRVYGQMADIFYDQALYRQGLQCDKFSELYAWKGKDTLAALMSYEQENYAYSRLGLKDSAIFVIEDVAMKYKKYGYHKNAAICFGLILKGLLEKGEYQKAKNYMDTYESESGFFDSKCNIESGREIYYKAKGLYYLYQFQYDSAEYYFRKELQEGKDFGNQHSGARGLTLLFQRLHKPDSIAKYALYTYAMNDSIYAQMVTDEIEQMHAMYNYSSHQKKAQEESEKAKRATELLKTVAAVLLIVILIAYIVIAREKQKRQDAVRNYRECITKIEQAQAELARQNSLTNNQEELIQHQKSQITRQDGMIAQLQNEISSFRNKVKKTKDTKRENDLKCTDEFKAFTNHAAKYTVPTNLEWTELRTKVFEFLPDFHQLLLSKRHELNISEYNVCILVRLQFKLSDIANLEGLSLSYINKIRKNLLKKLFEMEGKAEVFDEMIKEIY